MKGIVIKKPGIENLIESGEILEEELNKKLQKFATNDWGELNEDDKEEQNRMLLEGFYIKNRNPKLDEKFRGVYLVGNYIIWVGSNYDNEKEVLNVIVGLPEEDCF